MAAIEISQASIQKLTHESTEVRLRALNEIYTKLSLAQTHKEKLNLKPGELFKQLIRWFSFMPVQAPRKVLTVLDLILQDAEYGSKAIQKLGADRLSKELDKVFSLLKGHAEEVEIIDKINILKKHIDMHLCNQKDQHNAAENIEELINCTSALTLETLNGDMLTSDDYEIPWSRPLDADFKSMKFIADILINRSATETEMQNALLHLQITMRDYPVSHLLQAPHIFRNLLHRFDEQKYDTTPSIMIYVGSVLLEFLYMLQKDMELKIKTLNFSVSSSSLLSPVPSLTSCTSTSSTTLTSSTESIHESQTPTQLRVEKALSLLLNACIAHLALHLEQGAIVPTIWDITYMIFGLYKSNNWYLDPKILLKIAELVRKLQSRLHDSDNWCRLRMRQMHLLYLLGDMVEVCAVDDLLKNIESFTCVIKDNVFTTLFPKRFQRFCELVFKGDESLMETLAMLNVYEEAFLVTTKFLIEKPECVEKIFEKSAQVYLVLDKLRSKYLLDVLLNAIVECAPLYPANVELHKAAKDLLLKLLNLSYMPLKLYAFERLTKSFKQHIGCLMNGENTSSALVKDSIVGVPLSQQILLHLVYEITESTNNLVKENCIAVLTLFLKSHSLFGPHWSGLLNLLMHALPLLMCCTFSESLMSTLVMLHDPDSAQMPHLTILQGNVIFLYHKDGNRRCEATTRLFYMLNTISGSENYLPNIMEMRDTVPNDLCLLDAPRMYSNIFHDHSPVGSDSIRTLNNLLQLLDTADVEPVIRKTTLMQINVLCANWLLIAEFCKAGAYYLVMRVLDNALQKSSCSDYPDSAIHAVSIFAKVLLYDSALRCELAECVNIYHLLLRALIMYMHDLQMRQDASICLFLLVFANHLVVTENDVAAPNMLGYLQTPLKLTFRSALNRNDSKSKKLNSLFSSETDENHFWRLVIARVYGGGDFQNVTRSSISSQVKLDINNDFKLTLDDIRWIRSSHPALTVQRILHSATNATTHASLMQAFELLKPQLVFNRLLALNNFCPRTLDTLRNLLLKFIQLPPGNEDDLKVLESVLDVAHLCIRAPFANVICALATALQKDFENTLFMLILKKDETTLIMFYKITSLLTDLISKHKSSFKSSIAGVELNDFFGDLFDALLGRTRQFYETRNLQNARCLLSLLVSLSDCQLNKLDQEMFLYCQRLMKLSMSLRASTRTGAQWHRDCLLIILRLSNQMKECREVFRLSGQTIRFLSGLCGHRDSEVCILAWSILLRLCETVAMNSVTTLTGENDERKQNWKHQSGGELLISELSYLPGGFIACCLATLLDNAEIVCVRQLAGLLFAKLVSKKLDLQKSRKLLDKYRFFHSASEILHPSVCILSKDLPNNFETTSRSISNCELISSFVRICHAFALQSEEFLSDMCTQSFMFTLYEVLKRPPPEQCSRAFLTLIGDICRLYLLLYPHHFIYLQRIMCRDSVWLNRYCELMFQNNCNVLEEEDLLVDMLQFLMILCKDCTAFEQICENLIKYSAGFVKLFKYAFSTAQLGSVLQRCALSSLSLLLIKSQPELEGNDSRTTLLSVMEKSTRDNPEFTSLHDKDVKDKSVRTSGLTVAEFIMIALADLYKHIYPIKLCKFTTPPTELQQQVSETLSLLLKVSESAQKAAHKLKLTDVLLNIFKIFFDEYSGTPCTTFTRRYGETKKNAVVLNLLLVLKFLLYWHSSQVMMIKDDFYASELTKSFIQVWPWQVHSAALKLTLLRVCAFFSERSLVVCKQFSTLNSSVFAHSILQLVAKCVTNETTKVKAASTDCLPVIDAGLRILMNCCSCVEGRIALQKLRILDIFDVILTFKPKTSRPRPELQNVWLRFWELYSRYDEGAHVCHLNALCYAVNNFDPRSEMRLLALRILRNMSFVGNNRSALITSTNYLYTINEVLSQSMEDETKSDISYEEQLLLCVSLWKLMSAGIRFVAMIRGTKLAKHLRILHESLKNIVQEGRKERLNISHADDLLNVLEIIFKLFDKS